MFEPKWEVVLKHNVYPDIETVITRHRFKWTAKAALAQALAFDRQTGYRYDSHAVLRRVR